jgi:hypothetical protein
MTYNEVADEGRTSVEDVVNAVAGDFKTQEEVFDITREELKKLKDTDVFSMSLIMSCLSFCLK